MSADQHLHRTATRLSLDAGLGQRGYVNAPDDLWIHHNLPFQLPPHPPVLRKPSVSAYDTLTILRSLCRDHFCFQYQPKMVLVGSLCINRKYKPVLLLICEHTIYFGLVHLPFPYLRMQRCCN